MITAHLPAGYVLARSAGWNSAALAAALAGSIFPDLDLIPYLLQGRAGAHHSYWVHAPAFAIAVGAVLIALARLLRPDWTVVATAFAAAWVLHILIDTLTGEIMWLWPFSTELYALAGQPSAQHQLLLTVGPWGVAFDSLGIVFAELAVWAAAATLHMRRRTTT